MNWYSVVRASSGEYVKTVSANTLRLNSDNQNLCWLQTYVIYMFQQTHNNQSHTHIQLQYNLTIYDCVFHETECFLNEIH